MNIKILAIPACAAILTIGGCSIGKPGPQITTYVVEAAPPAPGTGPRRPETLGMGQVRVAAAYAGRELVYRMDDVKYIADPYESFITEPGGMFGHQIAAWLDRAGPFSAAQPGSARTAKSAPYALEVMVTELYGDFRSADKPAAVMTIQFALLDLNDTRQSVVYERTIGRRVDLAQATPAALVRGYDTGLTEILVELSAGLATVHPTR